VGVFVKNANRWQAAPLTDAEVCAYRRERAAHGEPPVVAHASYLINLAATNADTLAKSRAALKDELGRCHALGIAGLVLHPGAHLGEGIETGTDAAARSLDLVLAEFETTAPGIKTGTTTQVWLENTAGQGTVLGSHLEELSPILSRSDHSARLGICLDTCHAFAAGYPLHTEAGLERFLEEVEAQLGLERVGCFHLNDSRYPLGSHRDRHANLGAGEIGLGTFVRLASDARFVDLPMLLETPQGQDKQGHAHDLKRLRTALREIPLQR
jgi:deoxyribonuclease-4